MGHLIAWHIHRVDILIAEERLGAPLLQLDALVGLVGLRDGREGRRQIVLIVRPMVGVGGGDALVVVLLEGVCRGK